MELLEYIRVLSDIGFENIYFKSFSPAGQPKHIMEDHVVMWNDELGILINTDTIQGHIHECLAYFNLKIEDSEKLFHNPRSVSRVQDEIVYGYFEAKEGILTKIQNMQACGRFLKQWQHVPPDFGLVNYMDWNNINSGKLTEYVKQVTNKRLQEIKITHPCVYNAIYNISSGDNSDDVCKKCGGYGEVRLTACVCKQCGNTIWGC